METRDSHDGTVIAIRQSDGHFCAEVTDSDVTTYFVCECNSPFDLENGHVIRAPFHRMGEVHGRNCTTGTSIRMYVRTRHADYQLALRELSDGPTE